MRFKIHVPTREYAFIEVEHEGSLEEAVEIHKELDVLYADTSLMESLRDRDFNKFVDNILMDKENKVTDYDNTNVLQRAVINVFTRGKARLENKSVKE